MKKNNDPNYAELRSELVSLMATCGVSARILSAAIQHDVSQQAISAFLAGKVRRLHACTYPVYGDMLAALRYASVTGALPVCDATPKQRVDIVSAAIRATKE